VSRIRGDSKPPSRAEIDPRLVDLLQGRESAVWRTLDGSLTLAIAPSDLPAGILSGSFNPLHAGHEELRLAAERRLAGPVHFELPIVNADKPPLEPAEVMRRLAQFSGAHVAVTTAATFVEKAELLPGVAFVVGMDTAVRILDPRFYGGSDLQMERALERIAAAGCQFLVAGRTWDGRFRTLDDLPIPPVFCEFFDAIPEAEFRCDVSSTELRNENSV
jgi:hypothetical protein